MAATMWRRFRIQTYTHTMVGNSSSHSAKNHRAIALANTRRHIVKRVVFDVSVCVCVDTAIARSPGHTKPPVGRPVNSHGLDDPRA